MALNNVYSEEFSFPLLDSQDSSQTSGTDSPPLWKHSPENIHRGDHDRGLGRLYIGSNNYDDQRKSFSYVEMRSLWNVNAEKKMDMLWEYFNEELPPRSQSLRIEIRGDMKSSLFPDESSAVGCGMNLAKKKKKKIGKNVLELMRVLKKILVMRSSSHRS